jgi:hypothetical protein
MINKGQGTKEEDVIRANLDVSRGGLKITGVGMEIIGNVS